MSRRNGIIPLQIPRAPFLIYTYRGFVSSKLYDKRDDFDFDTVNFPFLGATFHAVPLMECIFLNL